MEEDTKQGEEPKKCCGKCKHDHVKENVESSEEKLEKSEEGVENTEVLEQAKKADEYLNNWKRERADFVNYKKDEMERTLSLLKHSSEKFVLKLLPVIDNIYLAERHLKDDGLAQIVKQFEEFLKKEGIEPIEVLDKPFDPNFMEVVAEVEASEVLPSAESGMVAEEMQKGYLINGKVLRPSKVKIIK